MANLVKNLFSMLGRDRGEQLDVNDHIDIGDFHSMRLIVCIENGEIISQQILGPDEIIMNRNRYIKYFREPDIGFNDIDQLLELSNSVNERIRAQVRNIQ